MNQQMDLAKRVSLLFICLSDEWAYQLLRHMGREGMQSLVHNLNLLKSISLYDCEAALIDVIEVLLREEETHITGSEQVIRMLRYALPDTEFHALLKEISTDRKEATQLLLLPENDPRQGLLTRHTLDVLSGIRSRLLDGLDQSQFQKDHFYKELLNSMIEKIEHSPRSVARQMEMALEEGHTEQIPWNLQRLSGRKKAAAALLQLGEDAISRIFRYLAATERQALAFEMICLKDPCYETELAALMEYMELLLNLKLIAKESKEDVREMILILKNELLDTRSEDWNPREVEEEGESQEILELFASQLYDDEESSLFFPAEASEQEAAALSPERIRELLLKIGQQAAQAHPRLVARAVRYMFKQ